MDSFKNPLAHKIEIIFEYLQKNKKQVSLIAAAVLVVGGVIAWHFIHRSIIQVRAHGDFVHAMEYFQAPVVGQGASSISFDTKEFRTKEEKWARVEELFRLGYENNKSSGLASIFLAFQAQALWMQDKQEESISILKQAIDIMPSQDLKSYYRIKLALLQIDSENKKLQDEGLFLLKELAVDEKSVGHDRALYRLGDYFWNKKQFDEARNYWNQLVLKYGKSSKKPSLFVQQAKTKLKLISAK